MSGDSPRVLIITSLAKHVLAWLRKEEKDNHLLPRTEKKVQNHKEEVMSLEMDFNPSSLAVTGLVFCVTLNFHGCHVNFYTQVMSDNGHWMQVDCWTSVTQNYDDYDNDGNNRYNCWTMSTPSSWQLMRQQPRRKQKYFLNQQWSPKTWKMTQMEQLSSRLDLSSTR